MKITERYYEYAKWRYRILRDEFGGMGVAAEDERVTELSMLAEMVKEYELEHLPFGKAAVADLIRFYLERRGMTQRQLAAEIGVSPSRVNDFISGRAEPSLKVAGRICGVLGIPAGVMMG